MLDNETLIRELTKALNEANERMQKVRELHKQGEPWIDQVFGPMVVDCDYCDQRYPCETIKALDGEQ